MSAMLNERPLLKFLHIADSHFGAHFSTRPKNQLRRIYGESFFQASEKVIRTAIREKVDFILHLGDFFNRSKPPSEVIDRSIRPFILAANKNIPIYVVPGNHERSRLPLGLIHYTENIHVFKQPCSFIFEKRNTKVKISGFPYIRHHARRKFNFIVKKAWQNIIDCTNKQEIDYSILAIHQLIEGSRIEHYTFKRGHNVILFDQVPNIFDYIACGHVHRFQFLYRNEKASIRSSNKFASVIQQKDNKKWNFLSDNVRNVWYNNPAICYSGSLERVSMAERTEPKGYIIGKLYISQSSGQITSASYTFHEIKALPLIYETWHLSNDSIIEYKKHILEEMNKISKERVKESLKAVYHVKILGDISKLPEPVKDIKDRAKDLGIYLTISIPYAYKNSY